MKNSAALSDLIWVSLCRYVGAIFLMLVSPLALAAGDTLPWKTYLFIVMAISVVVASLLVRKNPKAESTMGKLLLTGLYFWVLTFAQLTILALIYHFVNR